MCDRHNKVLLCTDRRPGDVFPRIIRITNSWQSEAACCKKIRVLIDRRAPKYYELSEALGPEGQNPDMFVHVVILPALLEPKFCLSCNRRGVISLLSILGSILIALVFSNFAFKPLSEVTRMLDHLLAANTYLRRRSRSWKKDGIRRHGFQVNLPRTATGKFRAPAPDQLEEPSWSSVATGALIVASGRLKFLGKRRVDLMGLHHGRRLSAGRLGGVSPGSDHGDRTPRAPLPRATRGAGECLWRKWRRWGQAISRAALGGPAPRASPPARGRTPA